MQKCDFENVVFKMLAISSRSQCVKTQYLVFFLCEGPNKAAVNNTVFYQVCTGTKNRI